MDEQLPLNFFQKFFKHIICGVNALFVILGIVMIALGGLILANQVEYNSLINDGIYSVPALLLILGCFTTILFFFGCCGLKKENHCMVMTFAVLLSVILILEVVAGISAYMLRSQTSDILQEGLIKSLDKAYNTSDNSNATTDLREAWDKAQVELHCCGVTNYKDYANTTFKVPPPSCCSSSINGTCDTTVPTNLWGEGCGILIENKLSGAISSAAKWVIAIAVLHLAWITAACYYATVFKNRQSYESV